MDPKQTKGLLCLGTQVTPPMLLLVAFAVFSISCRKATEITASAPAVAFKSNTVAVVAGVEISSETLKAELKKQFRVVPEGGLTVEEKLAALDGLVRNEAIYAQALAKGFNQTQEMQARIKQLVVAQFKEREFKSATPTVSDQEVQAAYENSSDRFAQPAAVRGAAIFLSVPGTATVERKAEFRARAEALLVEAKSVADETAFAKLVAQHSEDQATRYRGGDLGWLTHGASSVEAALAEALFALKAPGDFASLVQTSRGVYIAKLTEKRTAARKPLAEVRETIRYQLLREKTAQAERGFHAAMKAGIDITVNRELVESISLPAPKDAPPRLPEATTAQLP